MNKQDKDHIRQSLDREADSIDAATLSRLRQARSRAVEQVASHPWWRNLPVPASAIGATGVAALAAMLWLQQPATLKMDDTAQDIDILAAGEPLELYDDVEFLMWLAEQDIDVG